MVNSRIVYVADNEQKAWEDIEAAAMYQAALYGKWLSAATPGQNWILPDANQLKSSAIIGSPETVRSRLAEVIETAGATEMIINTQLPGLAPAKVMRSLEFSELGGRNGNGNCHADADHHHSSYGPEAEYT